MYSYKLIANKEDGTSCTLGTIKANSMNEAELFLAMSFPEDYYLSNIVCLDNSHFRCIASAQYFEDFVTHTVPDPMTVALKNIRADIYRHNDFCDIEEDCDSLSYLPWTAVVSKNNIIMKEE